MLIQPSLAAYGLVGTGIAISLSGVLSYGLTRCSREQLPGYRRRAATGTASGLVDGIGHLGHFFTLRRGLCK